MRFPIVRLRFPRRPLRRIVPSVAAVVLVGSALTGCHGGPHAVALITGVTDSSFFISENGRVIWYSDRFSGEIHRRNLSTNEDTLVFTVTNVLGGTEQGLFGVTLHPNYPTSPYLYAYATRQVGSAARNQVLRITLSGGVGLCATMGANLMGAGRIIAVESRPERQALAKRFGADDIVDFSKGDPVEQIMDLTGGVGVDAAIEAFGFPQTFEACVRVTKAGGRVSNVGYHGENPEPLQLPLDAIGLGMNDKSIHTGLCPGGSERMNRLMRLLESGRIDPTPMTTHTFPFDQIDEAFELMSTKGDGIVKPLITF